MNVEERSIRESEGLVNAHAVSSKLRRVRVVAAALLMTLILGVMARQRGVPVVPASAFALLVVALWIVLGHRATARARPTPLQRVVIDEVGVRRLVRDETRESVRWSHVVNVRIATTDEGPFLEDFYWLLQEADGAGCAIDSSLAATCDLLARLQRLPRFDNRAVMAASGSTANARFLCWEGVVGEALVCAADGMEPATRSTE